MTTKFPHTYRGQDVTVEVTSYTPFTPMVITGSGYGDAEPHEPEHIEFDVLDNDGEWLASERETTSREMREIMAKFKKVAADDFE